jgi:hypothetical protein
MELDVAWKVYWKSKKKMLNLLTEIILSLSLSYLVSTLLQVDGLNLISIILYNLVRTKKVMEFCKIYLQISWKVI